MTRTEKLILAFMYFYIGFEIVNDNFALGMFFIFGSGAFMIKYLSDLLQDKNK